LLTRLVKKLKKQFFKLLMESSRSFSLSKQMKSLPQRDLLEMLKSKRKRLKTVLIEVKLSLKPRKVKVVCSREAPVFLMPERMLKLLIDLCVNAKLLLRILVSSIVLQ